MHHTPVWTLTFGYFVTIWLLLSTAVPTSVCEKPNIVIMLADDLGMGDVGCFGNETIQTPNIDSIALQGVQLTQHLTAAAVCTPSRAALLTGRYPVRIGFTSPHRMGVLGLLASSGGLPPEELTFAKILKENGYSTALIGKWHLGLSCKTYGDNCHHPLNHGFDYYYGIPLTNLKDFTDGGGSVVTADQPHIQHIISTTSIFGLLTVIYLRSKNLMNRTIFLIILLFIISISLFVLYFISNIRTWNSIMMRNYDFIEQPIRLENLTTRLVKEGTTFIKQKAASNEPFLLFMSWVQVHTALHASKRFRGSSKHGFYGDNVQEMDWGVGEILKAVDDNGLKHNTFVYFSSDNGGHVEEVENGERAGGYNSLYRGGKMQGGMEGGIRVPTVVMWPNHLPPGHVVTEPVSMMDVFPTILRVGGAKPPSDRMIDGKDAWSLLIGESQVSQHEFLFHYCEKDIHAVRYRPREGNITWKIHYAWPNWQNGSEGCHFMCGCYRDAIWLPFPAIFDLIHDPSERNPVDTTSDNYSRVLGKANEAVKEHRNTLDKNVACQLSLGHVMWKPWLQPCCGTFPSCHCTDPEYP